MIVDRLENRNLYRKKHNDRIARALEFLASVTQHIPNKGEHQVRYYGWYSNKCRGMRARCCRQCSGGRS